MILERAFPSGRRLVPAIYAAFWLLHVTAGLFVAFEPRPARQHDEFAHLSFVAQQAAHPSLTADYESMSLLDGRASWLNHPTAYYNLMAPIYVLAGGHAELALRLANLALSAAAVALCFAVAIQRLSAIPAHLAFASAVGLCPSINVIAGFINNDNLAFLGGAIALYGLLRRPGLDWASLAICGGGLAVAGLSKLIAGLQVGILLAVVIAQRWRELPWSGLAVIAVGAVIAVSPYLDNLLRYGAPLYTDPGILLAMARRPLPFDSLLATFVAEMLATSMGGERTETLGVVSMLACIGLAARGGWSGVPLARAAWVATLAVLAIHFAFLYRTYRETGLWTGGYMRYYLPLWPALMFVAAQQVRRWLEAALLTSALLWIWVPFSAWRRGGLPWPS